MKSEASQVNESNPYSTCVPGQRNNILKVTICGLLLPVNDSVVLEMLHSFDITIGSDLKYENIRHSTTHRITSVLKGICSYS